MTIAQEWLTQALVHLAADGSRPPCGQRWEHEHHVRNERDLSAVRAGRCCTPRGGAL